MTMVDWQEIAGAIKAHRMSQGWSQQELADRVRRELPDFALSHARRAEKSPDSLKSRQLVGVLQVCGLVGLLQPNGAARDGEAPGASSREEMEMIRVYRVQPPSARRALREFLRSLGSA